MLLYLRMVLPSSRTPPPQFSASSTNRRTTHLAGRRRQPLTPQTWASPAEPLAPRHVRLPLTPPRASPASADEDTRSLTPAIIPHDAPHTQLEPTNSRLAACTATRRRDNKGLAFPAAEAVKGSRPPLPAQNRKYAHADDRRQKMNDRLAFYLFGRGRETENGIVQPIRKQMR